MLVMGSHARTVLEDNLYLGRGVKASNPLLVERLVRFACELGREPTARALAHQGFLAGVPGRRT
jgi:uncharacterized protein (DUF849 family)